MALSTSVSGKVAHAFHALRHRIRLARALNPWCAPMSSGRAECVGSCASTLRKSRQCGGERLVEPMLAGLHSHLQRSSGFDATIIRWRIYSTEALARFLDDMTPGQQLPRS
jgi:hypothetical protein